MIAAILAWLARRHQRAVLRRIAKLDAQIASAQVEASILEECKGRFTNSGQHQTLGSVIGRVEYLKKIRAHNFQHEDTL